MSNLKSSGETIPHDHFQFFQAKTLVFACLIFTVLLWSKAQIDEKEKFFREIHSVEIIIPTNTPAINQENLDFAMIAFGILRDPSIPNPQLDKVLEDRGLTARSSLSSGVQISIGPGAFESWSILASTLAHEFEVHGMQNFLLISVLDSLGFDGTGMAERQAYSHEIANARRFGLSLKDQESIQHTMNFYYPDPGSAGTQAAVAMTDKKHFGVSEKQQISANNTPIKGAEKIVRDVKVWLARNMIGQAKSY